MIRNVLLSLLSTGAVLVLTHGIGTGLAQLHCKVRGLNRTVRSIKAC